MARTAADFMAEALQNAGVRRVYGVGDSLNGFTDALRRIRASTGFTCVTRRPRPSPPAPRRISPASSRSARAAAVRATCTSSTGSTTAIAAACRCWRSLRIFRAGRSASTTSRPPRLFAECSHYVELVSSPEQLPQILERAMRTAIGRRGVAVVVVPGDVALASLDEAPPSWIAPSKPLLRPSEHDLQRLASLLNDAGAVTLLCGAGCAGAHAEVTALA